ncbi:hypothetical protein VTK73DRAFT_4059 [Phialemonium thermophilum]|uniref:Uncharacterized protein n=1 Tax=Phialemonium thermophilum TaxID=223376 RepID=A0ABR3WVE7_9PEZI
MSALRLLASSRLSTRIFAATTSLSPRLPNSPDRPSTPFPAGSLSARKLRTALSFNARSAVKAHASSSLARAVRPNLVARSQSTRLGRQPFTASPAALSSSSSSSSSSVALINEARLETLAPTMSRPQRLPRWPREAWTDSMSDRIATIVSAVPRRSR